LVDKQLNAPAPNSESKAETEDSKAVDNSVSPPFASKHHSLLMQAVADELDVKPDDIFDFEL
jgi:hypothetical protein